MDARQDLSELDALNAAIDGQPEMTPAELEAYETWLQEQHARGLALTDGGSVANVERTLAALPVDSAVTVNGAKVQRTASAYRLTPVAGPAVQYRRAADVARAVVRSV